MKDHHGKCAKAQAWDIEDVPCTCPRGWPRESKPAVPLVASSAPGDDLPLRQEIALVLKQVEMTCHRADALPPNYQTKPTIPEWRERVTWLVSVLTRVAALLDAPARKLSTKYAGSIGDIPVYSIDGALSPDAPYEYDQGHAVVVWYDDLYNLNQKKLAARSVSAPVDDPVLNLARQTVANGGRTMDEHDTLMLAEAVLAARPVSLVAQDGPSDFDALLEHHQATERENASLRKQLASLVAPPQDLLDELEIELKRIGAINRLENRERVVPELTVFMWLQKARLASAPVQPRDEKQELIDWVYGILTSTPAEIAKAFGESRVVDDSCRINYALELMAAHVSPNQGRLASAPAPEADTAQPHCENCGAVGVELQELMCRSCWENDADGPPFHWRDGVYFQRLNLGAVLLTLSDGVWKMIPLNEWQSIVAHVVVPVPAPEADQ